MESIQDTKSEASDVPEGNVGRNLPIQTSVQEKSRPDNRPSTDVPTHPAMISTGKKHLPAATIESDPDAVIEMPDEVISLAAIADRFGTYPVVLFDFNSNNLGASEYEKLDMIARFCLQHPETLLVLRGYTDKSGVRAYNLKLSEFRAKMVKTFLVGRGVKDSAISTIAVGPDPDGPSGTTIPYDGKRRKVVIEIVAPTPAE
jgi:outer membrane protein OmpA-like peptidoglycan-associated protein